METVHPSVFQFPAIVWIFRVILLFTKVDWLVGMNRYVYSKMNVLYIDTDVLANYHDFKPLVPSCMNYDWFSKMKKSNDNGLNVFWWSNTIIVFPDM